MARYTINDMAAREARLRETLRRFMRSRQGVLDFEALLIAGYSTFKNGLDHETVHRIISEVLAEEHYSEAAD